MFCGLPFWEHVQFAMTRPLASPEERERAMGGALWQNTGRQGMDWITPSYGVVYTVMRLPVLTGTLVDG